MGLPPDDPPPGVPDWILTYGDMMSLLLCFFILLAAMSEIKKDEKEQAVIRSILEQFGDHQALSMYDAAAKFSSNAMKAGSTLEPVNIREPTNRKRAEAGSRGAPGKNMRVTTIRDGKRLVVGGPVLFAAGSDELNADLKDTLLRIADELRGKQHLIEIRGYMPPAGIHSTSKFKSTLELAFARTEAVVRFLVDVGQMNRDILRLTIAAPLEGSSLPKADAGEPIAERVDILTLEASSQDFGFGSPPPNNE